MLLAVARGRAGLLLCVSLVCLSAWASPARAAGGSWNRAWGQGVNGGSKFGICTVAAHCRRGSGGGLGGAINLAQGDATDAAGNVYVADADNNRIEKFDSKGHWLMAWGKGVNGGGKFGICTVAAHCRRGSGGGLGGEMAFPDGLAVGKAGNVYVSDASNDRIQEFDSKGHWLRAFGDDVGGSGVDICTVAANCQAGSTGGLGGEMIQPSGIATDKTGNVYVADHGNNRIQEFDSTGHWLRAFGDDVGGSGVDICTVAANCQAGSTGGLGGEMNPVGVGTDTAGDVYVTDQGNNRIQKFDPKGHWLRAFGDDVGGSGVDICTVAANCQAGSAGGLGGELSGPGAVATDSAGEVYVADTNTNRIQKFDSKGHWLRAWGKGVNGGTKFGICTVAAHCLAGSKGGLGGAMFSPRGIATDTAGNVDVADGANNRIQKFR